MGLTTSLQLGRSALMASQVAIQVAGNNIANAATPGYSRQDVSLSAVRGQSFGGSFLGRGVRVEAINRQVDLALRARVRAGVSNEMAANTKLALLSNVEATINELTDSDLSTQLSEFFSAWSDLANNPGSEGADTLVIETGAAVAGYIRSLRGDLDNLRAGVDRDLTASARQADDLLSQIAAVNAEISIAESGRGQASALRDQRDRLIGELSQLIDVTAIEQASGSVDILVGSTPVLLGADSRGIVLETVSGDNGPEVAVRTRVKPETLEIESGRIGGLLEQRGQLVSDTLGSLDRTAAQIIAKVNRVYSQGYSRSPMREATGTLVMEPADRTRALNDPANRSIGESPIEVVNGAFTVTVTNTNTGSTETLRIEVDLDGINNAGAAGSEDDASAESIRAALDAVPNLSASFNNDGTLRITAAPGYEMGFSEDTSGALAALGVNTFFTGADARDIDVRGNLLAEPSRINTGMLIGGDASDNGAALRIALLQDEPVDELGGVTIAGAWRDAVSSVGVRTGAAVTRAEAATLVRESIEAQERLVSGVSVDEESIDLMTYQRQFEGSARFISAVDQMTQTLISLVG